MSAPQDWPQRAWWSVLLLQTVAVFFILMVLRHFGPTAAIIFGSEGSICARTISSACIFDAFSRPNFSRKVSPTGSEPASSLISSPTRRVASSPSLSNHASGSGIRAYSSSTVVLHAP
ncbi:MAG: hypothetical protein ACOC84_01590 [Actinomycetota bacterium]